MRNLIIASASLGLHELFALRYAPGDIIASVDDSPLRDLPEITLKGEGKRSRRIEPTVGTVEAHSHSRENARRLRQAARRQR